MDSFYEDLIKKNEDVHPLEKDIFGNFEIPKHVNSYLDLEASRCKTHDCCFLGRPILGSFSSRKDVSVIDVFDRSKIRLNKNWVRVYGNGKKLHVMHACPLLDEAGFCSDYESRPQVCRDFGPERGCDFKDIKLLYERKNNEVTYIDENIAKGRS